jgi:O-antigen/teichoic acid export membrane protein
MRALLANTAWLAGESVFRIVASLVVGIWMARYLGPQDLGRFAYCLAYIALFLPFAQAGLDRIAVRQLSVDEESRSGETLACVFAIRLVFGAGAAAAAIVMFPLASGATDPVQFAMICVIAAGLAFVCFDAFDFWFQSRQQMRWSALSRNAGFVASTAARVLLMLAGAALFWFSVTAVLEVLVTGAALYFAYRMRRPAALAWRFSIRRAIGLLRESGYVVAYAILVVVQARIDQLMLAQMYGPAELGQYAVALGIVENLSFLPMAILAAMSPLLAKLRAADPAHFRRELLNFYRWVVVLFLPVGMTLAIFSGSIVHLLYGASYAPAAPLLSLLTLRLLLAYVAIARSAYVVNERLFALSLVTTAIGAFLNLSLNLLWMPEWGAKGAVCASTVSFFFTIVVADLLFKQTRPNFFLMARALVTPWRARMVDSR